jgi:hypothetical protein
MGARPIVFPETFVPTYGPGVFTLAVNDAPERSVTSG